MMFQAEQTILDEYNNRYPLLTHYRLVRVSRLHDTAHIAAMDDKYTVCGTRLYEGFDATAEGASGLCARCTRIMVRRLA